MPNKREPITWVEIDVDQCSLTYGVAPCMAALGGSNVRKCFNSFNTCQDKANFTRGSLTYKFYSPQSVLPKEPGVFPCLMSVSESAAVVNIAGTNEKLSSFGKRERISFTCKDFPYGDQYTDKYAAERKSGAAQLDGIGYDPYDRGTFFGKLRARWPYYAGRPCRRNSGYIDNGVLTDVVTENFILTDMAFDVNGEVTFEAKDILALADDQRVTAPIANNGQLKDDIDEQEMSFTIEPENIGDIEYPASGRAAIGNEIITYTRSGDVFTITERGVAGTEIGSHRAGASVQEVFYVNNMRADDVLYTLLVDYAKLSPSYIDKPAWEDEFDRWGEDMYLTGYVVKPTGVSKLISEIVQLGLSVWWDAKNQKVGVKLNRPPDQDRIFLFTDDRNIKQIDIEDRDDSRFTQVGYYSDIINPTGDVNDGSNYNRLRQLVDLEAQSDDEFGDTRIQRIYTRWLGDGNDDLIRILGIRFLNRFRWAPSYYKFRVTYDPDLGLTDVVRVNSRVHQDATGENLNKLMQVVSIVHDKPKHEMVVTAQAYQFDQRYGLIAPNDMPDYTSASPEQRNKYAFFADNDAKMSNGDYANVFI